jgi:hypothetical protein
MKEWIKVYCRFCNKPFGDYKCFPPDCDCSEYQEAKSKWLEERKKEKDYEELLTLEEYDKKYPKVYFGSRTVKEKDSEHELNLEVRKYSDSVGLTVKIPFGNSDAGLCWDFTNNDAIALYELLGEYLEK